MLNLYSALALKIIISIVCRLTPAVFVVYGEWVNLVKDVLWTSLM